MKANPGERYTCTDPDCGCEIQIIRPCNAAIEDPEEDATLSCFCGSEMELAGRSSAAPA